ncbi:hypothetical protein [Paradesulfitobacterium aromaticivorans]
MMAIPYLSRAQSTIDTVKTSTSGHTEVGQGTLLTFIPLKLDDHKWFLITYSRSYLNDRFKDELDRYKRNKTLFSVAFIDLDF